jgi:four helix bundle protein
VDGGWMRNHSNWHHPPTLSSIMNYKFQEYQNLDVWKTSYNLARLIYQLTKSYPKEEIYGMTQQSRRAVISVLSNISEGCGRNHTRDKLQFYFISRGSLFELEAQIQVAIGIGFISASNAKKVINQMHSCKKLLSGFINFHKLKLTKS